MNSNSKTAPSEPLQSHDQSCPACGGNLIANAFADKIAYSKCDACAGLLMTQTAFEQLKAAWLSESVVDSEPPSIGLPVSNQTVKHCPQCHEEMTTMVDPEQSHVCLDCCASCDLLFFDAGEFTDLKQLTLMDYVWSFMAKLKSGK